MKRKTLILSIFLSLALSACTLIPFSRKTSSQDKSSDAVSSSETTTSSETSKSSSSSSSGNSSGSGSSSSESGPKKVTVAAHTLKDSNPPINVNSQGQQVSKETWESFRNAADSKFKGNYNYTYTAYSGGNVTVEKFTKNGYYMQSSAGRLYYERKSGSTFYNYISTSEGYLRQETTLDIESKYIYRIQQEIYVHMFDYENYEYNDYDGCYYYVDYGFGATVMFQGGYLTFLTYSVGTNIFRLEYSFETTIDIPESYYYQ